MSSSNQQQVFYKDLVVFLYSSFKAAAMQDRLEQADIKEYKREYIKPLFPQKIIEQQGESIPTSYTCGQICCQINTGYFCCGDSEIGSEQMIYFGLGINMYFKYVKYLISFFAIAAGISLIPLYLYYVVSQQNDLLLMDINSILFSSTIGSLSAANMKCIYSDNKNVTLTPNCSLGTINISTPVYSNNSVINLKNCKYELTNSLSNISILKKNQYDISCDNTTCKAKINQPDPSQGNFISIPFACKNPDYPILTLNINNNKILIVIIVCDLAIMVIFLLFTCIQASSQNKDVEKFQEKSSSLNDFSLEIKGFKFGNHVQNSKSQIVVDFIKNLRLTLEEKGLVDVGISKFKVQESTQKIGIVERKKQIYNEMYQIFEQEFFQKNIEIDKLNLEQFQKLCDIPKLKKKIFKLIDSYRSLSNKAEGDPFAIFITFQTNLIKEKALAKCESFCFKKYLKIQQVQYEFKDAPIPDLIMWQNLDRNVNFRTCISWLVTIIILIISYALIAYAYQQKNILIAKYGFTVDCTLKYQENAFKTYNASQGSDPYYKNCYCSSNLFTITSRPQCMDWLQGYTFYNLSPIFISVIIVIYNMIVSYIFKKLSQFECRKYSTEQLYSYVLKRTLLLLLNTGLVVLLINMKLDVNLNISLAQFLFGGTYLDFTADWYYNIGIVILLTMLFNIFMPISQLIIQWFLNIMLQMIDKRCWLRKSSKKTKTQYFKLYSGMAFPIQQRYAQLLSILFITFAYNQVIPLLNIVAFLSFLILFLTDKVLIFRFFKLKNYDEKLQVWVRRTAMVTVVIHCVISIFFLSEPELNPSTFTLAELSMITNARLNSISHQIQIYPYVVLLALFILWFIFQNTLIRLIELCTSKIKTISYIEKNCRNFYETLSKIQIDQLLRMNLEEYIKYQHQNQMHQVKLSYLKPKQTKENLSYLSPTMSVFRLTEKNMDELPSNITNQHLNQYTKLLYNERKALIKEKQTLKPKGKLISMPGYDVKFAGDNNTIEKQLLMFESKIENLYYTSFSTIQTKQSNQKSEEKLIVQK